MKRIAILSLLAFLGMTSTVDAQGVGSVTIQATHRLAKFTVDGQTYYGGAQVFLWAYGSTHIVEFPLRDDGYQYADSQSTRFIFSGWTDGGSLLHGGVRTITVTAGPQITQFIANVTPHHRTPVLFYGAYPPGPLDATPTSCAAPGDGPPDEARVGVVIVAGACLWNSAELWLPEGRHIINAFPYPGYVFEGIKVYGPGTNFLTSVELRGPATVHVQFSRAKRVRFLTEPMGLRVLIDRTETPTAIRLPCPNFQTLPPGAPARSAPLCFGEFDWANGSVHQLGATSPQFDQDNNMFVFHSFSDGTPENGTYRVTNMEDETIVARFVRGARVGFLTSPSGLKLSIDGRDNWTSYNFAWAAGSKHTVTAPEEQVDSRGRRYRFKRWSNDGARSQEITVPEGAAADSVRYTAEYELLSQVTIRSTASGASVEVDGADCNAPCVLDRPDGTRVRVAARQQIALSEAHRLEFVSWSDGGALAHEIAVTGADARTITVTYRSAYRLMLAADPAAGARFTVDPSSPDGFYADGTSVTIATEALAGFRFRRWAGDLEGTSRVGFLRMNAPHGATALLDRVPFIAPAGIRNAAAETPDAVVSPYSLVTIFGENLAPGLEIGPQTPLAQTLAGVTVTSGGRILPLLFVSPRQINALLSADLAEGDHTLTVRWGANQITGSFQVARNAPGLFTAPEELKPEGLGAGQPMALGFHDDGSPVTASAPARRGRETTLYGTGFGPLRRLPPFGFATPEAIEYLLEDEVQVFAGETPLEVVWSGAAPGMVATIALRLRIPDDFAAGVTVPVTARVNGRTSNAVYLPVE
jgi:uncharacterized protein (TIGR03437 family)